MIERLRIIGFQAHEKTTIDLDRKITVVVGDSDMGKTSIVRALKWLAFNRPVGNSFIRHGADKCRVSATVDGHELTREKGPATNVYRLDGRELKAVSTSIPDEVSSLLNLDPINFQFQFEAPFWFSLTAGEVSRELNSIVNLGLIDSTLANVASELRTAKATVGVTEERLRQAQETSESLAWANEAYQELIDLENLQKSMEENAQNRSRIADIIREWEEYAKELQNAAQAKLDAENALYLGDHWEQVETRIVRLQEILREWVECENKVKEARQERERLEKELETKMGGRCPICNRSL